MLQNGEYSKESRDLLDAAIEAVTAFDQSGKYSFAIVSESLRNNGKLPGAMDQFQFYMYEETNERIQSWVINFADFVHSESSIVRMWVIENLPNRTDSPDEDRLNLIIDQLLDDSDAAIADEAEKRKLDREFTKPAP